MKYLQASLQSSTSSTTLSSGAVSWDWSHILWETERVYDSRPPAKKNKKGFKNDLIVGSIDKLLYLTTKISTKSLSVEV